ncbi:hypothetical protein ACFSRY_05125 [Pontibacter locisalis]|uniref:Uncharacterized protein n=1 Tax=Pontibacter locisalis TaxID=1719035 RepID=A0ABW5IIL1_9BACT
MEWIPIEDQYPQLEGPIIFTLKDFTFKDKAGDRTVELGYVNAAGDIFTLQHYDVITSRE